MKSDNIKNDENTEKYSDDSSKFYGAWLESADNQGVTMTMKHTYLEDGTYIFEIVDINHLDNGTWIIGDGKITTITSNVNIYTYFFSDNNNTLTLKEITTEQESVLTKQ